MNHYLIVIIIFFVLLILIYTDALSFTNILLIYLCNIVYFISINQNNYDTKYSKLFEQIHTPVDNMNNAILGRGENEIIIYNDNSGRGLRNDNNIVEAQFKADKSQAVIINSNRQGESNKKPIIDPVYKVFIHQQGIKTDAMAKYHIWIPNQELITDWDLEQVSCIDMIICKTLETERKLTEICKTMLRESHSLNDKLKRLPEIVYTGFTTNIKEIIPAPNKYKNKNTLDNPIHIIHLGGSSAYKNTPKIIDAIIRSNLHNNPNIKITITIKLSDVYLSKTYDEISRILKDDMSKNIKGHVNEIICQLGNMTIYDSYDNIDALYNSADIALCLSSNEGFGHYINEALYHGCLPLVMNAPPMNEYFSNGQFNEYLVNFDEQLSKGFIHELIRKNYICSHDISRTTAYVFDYGDFVSKLDNLISIVAKDQDELQRRIKLLRELFELKKIEFSTNFKEKVINRINTLDYKNLEFKSTKITLNRRSSQSSSQSSSKSTQSYRDQKQDRGQRRYSVQTPAQSLSNTVKKERTPLKLLPRTVTEK